MRGGEDDTVPVDLIEVDSPDALVPPSRTGRHGADGGDRADGDHASDTADGAWRVDDGASAAGAAGRRRRRVLLGVALGVVLAIAATGGVLAALDARRADARWDALAGRGWPLVDLDVPLEEAWRADGGGWPMVVSSDVIIVQGWSPTVATSTWRAIDTATGATRWERLDLGIGWCTPWDPTWELTDLDLVAYGAFVADSDGTPRGDPTLLVCSDTSFGGEVLPPGATSTVRVVDVADGREVGTVSVPGSVFSFTPVGDDVIVSAVSAAGSVDLTRADLRTGDVQWTVATDVSVFLGAWPQVLDGAVVLASPDGDVALAVDVETGAPTSAPDLGPVQGAQVLLPDGSRALVDYGLTRLDDGSGDYLVGDPSVTVVGPDGQERFSVPGELWTPWFSDGSMPDRVVVSRPGPTGGTTLVALDVVTGAELWTSSAAWSSTVVQVDGVVVSGSGYLSATDLRTGEELWERRGTSTGLVSPVTDGSRLAVPVAEDGEAWLVALDIRTGAQAWRVPAIPSPQVVSAVGGGVLLGNDTTLAFYR